MPVPILKSSRGGLIREVRPLSSCSDPDFSLAPFTRIDLIVFTGILVCRQLLPRRSFVLRRISAFLFAIAGLGVR